MGSLCCCLKSTQIQSQQENERNCVLKCRQKNQNNEYVLNMYNQNDNIELEKLQYKNTKIFIPPIHKAYVCKVYDGDTFTIATKLFWDDKNIYRFSVRIKGIDCPEMKTSDSNEKYVALQAKDYLIKLLEKSNNWVILDNIIYDKYGRLCADVYINTIKVSNKMIEKRLAIQYDGGTKHTPSNWKNYYENK